MKIRRLEVPDPDPWLKAVHAGEGWLATRLPRLGPEPSDLPAWAERVARAQKGRDALADALERRVRTLGSDPAALASTARLRQPEAVAVVTGQQAGALLGPLFTVAKAAGAVAYARELEGLLGRPVVPLFWVATEDHDLGEVNRVRLPAPGGGRVDLHLFDPVPPGRQPVGPRDVRGPMEALVEAVRASGAAAGPYREEVLDLARDLVADHPTLGGHFSALLARVFWGSGLVILDPMDPALRRLAAEPLARALEAGEELERAVAEASAAVQALGYPPQVEWRSGDSGVFHLVEGERQMLVRRGPDLAPRERPDLAAPAAAWVARARQFPEQFSPNALVRPAVQQAILPTLAVVLGPGETRYFGQLKEPFRVLGLELPVVLARPRLTLVNGTVSRLLRRLGLTVEQVARDWPGQLAALLAERDRVGIAARFDAFAAEITEAHRRLAEALAPLGESLPELAEKTRQKILTDVQWLRAKAEHAHRQGNETLIRQYHHVGEALWPEGEPQDRYWSALAFLVQHGVTLGTDLAATPGLTGHGLLQVDLVEVEAGPG